MKKTSKVTQRNEPYTIDKVIDNIAIVNNSKGEPGLLDIRTGKIVCDFDDSTISIISNIIVQKLAGTIKLRFFDPEKVEMIADYSRICWIDDDLEVYVIEDADTGKYRLINLNYYGIEGDISERLYDEIEFAYSERNIDYFKIVHGSKTYLYSTKFGFVEHEDFEEIHQLGCINIFKTKAKSPNKYYFEYLMNGQVIKEEFESYHLESLSEHFLYCKKQNSLYIYLVSNHNFRIIAVIPDCEKISILAFEFFAIAGVFKLENNGKKGALLFKNDQKILTRIEYDDIQVADEDFLDCYLIKGNKKGICGIKTGELYFKEPLFDEIVTDHHFFVITKNGKSSRVHEEYFLNYDIEPINSEIYIVSENGKKGLVSNEFGVSSEGKLVIPVQYESIEIKEKNDKAFIVLRNGEDFKFLIYNYYTMWEDPNEYSDIQLLRDIIVKKDAKTEELLVYDYSNTLLSKFPPNSIIRQLSKKESQKVLNKAKSIYSINGEYYYCFDNKLIKLPNNQVFLYTTAYEGEFGTVFVSDVDKEKHDSKCAAIEQIPEEELEATLKEHFKSSPELQEQYPTLTLKLDK